MSDHSQTKLNLPIHDGIKDIIAGTFRGITQVAVGHPLDTLKVRMQVQSKENSAFSGGWDCFMKTLKDEGFRGFYKGASSPLFFCSLYSASLFFSYGTAQRFFYYLRNGERKLTNTAERKRIKLNKFDQMMCGVFSGFFCAFIEGPMELFKCKMQVQLEKQRQQNLSGKNICFERTYKSAFDVGINLIRERGFFSIFQGTFATIVRNVPGSSVYFTCYETMIQYSQKRNPSSIQPSSHQIMVIGGLSGMTFWISVYPLDVIKSRVQTDHPDPLQRKYKGVLDCGIKIFKIEGPSALYRGLSIVLIRSFPTNALSFLAFETVRSLI